MEVFKFAPVHTLKFYKENETWYADVPEYNKEDNEMVMGSDTFLETFSQDGEHCTIEFYTDSPNQPYIMLFEREQHDWDGAYYIGKGNYVEGMRIWICNVTHTVCGEHPEKIFITNIY